MVAASLLVLIPYAPQRLVVEDAILLEQNCMRHLAQFAPEPLGDRNGESLLAPSDHRGGHHVLNGSLKDVLAISVPKLKPRGDAGR